MGSGLWGQDYGFGLWGQDYARPPVRATCRVKVKVRARVRVWIRVRFSHDYWEGQGLVRVAVGCALC